MPCDASSLLTLLQTGAGETSNPHILGARVVHAVKEAMPQASWVGIYWLQGRELVLGPYEGAATEHTRIAVGEGVCGTAISAGADQRVSDVREIDNYLACSPDVRSELVVLIRSDDRIVGQLDLDANEVGAFSENDHCVLRAVAEGLGAVIEPPTPAVVDDPLD